MRIRMIGKYVLKNVFKTEYHKKIKERKINMLMPYNYAFQIETTIRAIFNCKKFGLGVIAEKDFIEKNPFIPIVMVLGNFYNKMDDNSKGKIDDYIETYHWLMDKSIEEIGEERIKNIIKEFNDIVSTA